MAIDKPLNGLLSQDDFEMGPDGLLIAEEEDGLGESLVTELDDGGVLVDFDPLAELLSAQDQFDSNLAEFVDDQDLNELANDCVAKFESDRTSRSDWEETYKQGLDQLGLEMEDRTTPWAGACGVFHPMLSEAVVRFQSQTIQEIMPAKGPVRTQCWGVVTDDRIKQAHRVQEYMNYQLLEVMTEYRSETEKLLFSLPLAGSAFRKIYFDPSLGRPTSMFVPAEDFVVAYHESDLDQAERYTHVMNRSSNQVRKLQVNGFYRDVELQTSHVEDNPITEMLRQLVDAGTLSNLPGGLKTRGLRIKGDDTPIMPGEFRDVDVPGGVIRDNITFLPYKEPSSVLYQLLGNIVDEGRRFASMADMKVADMNQNAPVGTTLAIMERAMKVQSAIQARIHASLKQEYKILAGIIRDYTSPSYPYETEEGEEIKAADFDDRVDVIPVSDPNASTMSQRIMQYQAAMQLAQQSPGLYDMPLLHRQMMELIGIPNADKIVPMPDEIIPTDPVSENEDLLTMKPVKAFEYQDHEAHMKVHMVLKNDPQIKEQMQNNKMGGPMAAALDAHIREHLAFIFRSQIEEELGFELPPTNQPLPADIEKRLSGLVSEAADQMLGKKQAKAKAQQDAKMQKDPIVQQREKELQIRQQDVQRKAQADQGKLQLEQQKLLAKQQSDMAKDQLEREKIAVEQGQFETEKELEIAKLGLEEAHIETQQEIDGMKLGIDIARTGMDE